jgi:hypothetical protein
LIDFFQTLKGQEDTPIGRQTWTESQNSPEINGWIAVTRCTPLLQIRTRITIDNRNMTVASECIAGNGANGWWNHHRAESGVLKCMGLNSFQSWLRFKCDWWKWLTPWKAWCTKKFNTLWNNYWLKLWICFRFNSCQSWIRFKCDWWKWFTIWKTRWTKMFNTSWNNKWLKWWIWKCRRFNSC